MFILPVVTFTLADPTLGLELCQESLHSSLQRLLRRIHQLVQSTNGSLAFLKSKTIPVLWLRGCARPKLPTTHDCPNHRGRQNFSLPKFKNVGSSPPLDKTHIIITPTDTWVRAMTLLRDPQFENEFRCCVGEICRKSTSGADAIVTLKALQRTKQNIVDMFET